MGTGTVMPFPVVQLVEDLLVLVKVLVSPAISALYSAQVFA